MTTTTSRTRPSGDPLDRYGVAREDRPEQSVELERVGQSYRCTIKPLGAILVFREVRVDRDLSADIAVATRRGHVFRTGVVSLGMRSRSEIARTAQELSGVSDLATWKQGVFAAAELVMEAEEHLSGAVDLRTASLVTNGALYAVRPVVYSGPTTLTMPGKAGKSSISRAWAASVVTGITIIPGCVPTVRGPVLYVAAEAPIAASHARGIEAIARGLGIDRSKLAHEIKMQPTYGRPLHRIARSLAEQAADYAMVVLDSYQALQSTGGDHGGPGIRERDTLFWSSLDQFDRPVLIVAHPNREDARRWDRVKDGRPAGSEVARDRSRMNWMGKTKDLTAIEGQRYRRYTLINTWFNDGPTQRDVRFGMQWMLGADDEDPGTVYFNDFDNEPTSIIADQPAADRDGDDEEHKEVPGAEEIGQVMRDTLSAWRAGIRTPGELRARHPEISSAVAKQRLRRLREWARDAAVDIGDDQTQTTMEAD